MRFVKLAIISAVVLFLIIFAITSLIPSHVRISRAVNIHAPQAAIMGQVLKIEEWQGWNELLSDSVSIKMTHATADTVKTVWKSHSGREIAGTFTFQQSGEVTVVQWYFDFHLRWYPWEKFASINFDKQWGPAMEKSLDNLKNIAERL